MQDVGLTMKVNNAYKASVKRVKCIKLDYIKRQQYNQYENIMEL